MGSVKFGVHPLTLIIGVFYALTGRTVEFIIYTLSAVAHELGHSLVAGRLGYQLNKITLMPFGAIVSGNIDGLKCKDQIKIALAGPLVNLVCGLFFVALWWIVPELYAYTDVVAFANLSLFTVNLLPIMPLDGGRVLYSMLSIKWGKDRVYLVCRVIGIIMTGCLLAGFVVTAFGTPNFSLLLFAVFCMVGTFSGEGRKNKYVKVYSAIDMGGLKRGMEVKRHAVDKSVTLKSIIKMLDSEKLNEIAVYDGYNQVAMLSQDKINNILIKGSIYSAIGEFI